MANEYQEYRGQMLGTAPSGMTKKVNVDSNGNIKTTIIGNLQKVSDTITRPNDTNAYTSNDVVSTITGEILEFDTLLTEGAGFIITSVDLEIDINAIPSGMSGFKLHLYDTSPTVIADNVIYNLPSEDRAKYLGNILINKPSDLGDTLWSRNDNLNFCGKLTSGSSTLYGILETTAGYTPSANTVAKVIIYISTF